MHVSPVADTHPRSAVKISVSLQATQRSAITARVPASMRGCVPSPHCSQMPSTPAWPGGHGSQPVRAAVGMRPSVHAWHTTRSGVWKPASSHSTQVSPVTLKEPSPHASHAVRLEFGCVPATQSMLHTPAMPALPVGHATQVTLFASGCVPAGQLGHVPSTPAVPDGQGSQKV